MLVPVGLTPGQYIVRIDSSVNSSVIADSAEFTIDDEHRERCVRYALLLLGLPSACRLPYALIRKVAPLSRSVIAGGKAGGQQQQLAIARAEAAADEEQRLSAMRRTPSWQSLWANAAP